MKKTIFGAILGFFLPLAALALPVQDSIDQRQIATPSSPSSGRTKLYPKTDGQYYTLDSSGAESPLGGSGAGGVNFVGLSTSWVPNALNDRNFDSSVGNWLAYDDGASATPVDGTGGSPGVTCLRTTTAAELLNGAGSLEMTFDAADRQGEGCAVVFNVPPGYQGKWANIEVPFKVTSGSVASGDIEVYVYRVTATARLITPAWVEKISGTSGTLRANFLVDPSEGTPANMQHRLVIHRAVTTATAATISLDDVVVGPGSNIQVSQAVRIGTLAWSPTTSCTWTDTTGASPDNFDNDNDCDDNARTATGIVSDGSVGLRPAFTITNGPAGEYTVTVLGQFEAGVTGASTQTRTDWRLFDGSSQYGNGVSILAGGSSSTALNAHVPVLQFTWRQETPLGTKTIDLQAAENSTNPQSEVVAVNSGLKFVVDVIPLSSQQGYRPDVTPASWAGFNTGTGCTAWSNTGSTLDDPSADADCDLTETSNQNFGTVTAYTSAGSELPGIVFTPPRVGKYKIEACGTVRVDNNARVWQLALTADGSTYFGRTGGTTEAVNSDEPFCVKGDLTLTSLASTTVRIHSKVSADTVTIGNNSFDHALEWTVLELDAAMPTPLLVGSVTSNSSGVERIERATIAACGADPCTITRQSGSWLTAANRSSGGEHSITIAANIFSGAPTCSCTTDTAGQFCSISVASATSATTSTRDHTGAAQDPVRHIICMGPR